MKNQIKVIEPNSIVEMSIGTEFYKRIQELVFFITNSRTQEEIDSALQQIKDQKITDDWVKHYETLLIFANEYEKKIIEQGLFTVIES